MTKIKLKNIYSRTNLIRVWPRGARPRQRLDRCEALECGRQLLTLTSGSGHGKNTEMDKWNVNVSTSTVVVVDEVLTLKIKQKILSKLFSYWIEKINVGIAKLNTKKFSPFSYQVALEGPKGTLNVGCDLRDLLNTGDVSNEDKGTSSVRKTDLK